MTRSLSETLAGRPADTWAIDFLHAAGFSPTPANVQAVVSWEYAESAGGGGMFNPLNTTQGGYPGETDFNSVGVKNYPDWRTGIVANARVIHNGYYDQVCQAFQNGTDARTICDLITMSPWGTGPITLRGTPITPAPPTVGETVLIASPHKPTTPGRTPAAFWTAALPNGVALTNGARIKGDKGHLAGAHLWAPPLQAGRHGIGIMATVGHDGRPDGRGIVLQDDLGQTYIGEWLT